MPKPIDKTGDIADRLAQFAPVERPAPQIRPDVATHQAPAPGSWPSRESNEFVPQSQVSIKGPAHIIDRFKAMCESGRLRYKYFDMLELLMDRYEGKD